MNKQTSETNILSPKLDVVFQALFGEVGSEKITTRFLEAILKEKVDNIDLSKNPILRREHSKDKLGVLDILAKINDKENCNIEMQYAYQAEIVERILYYWARTYSKQLKIGDNYNLLQKTIIILIANFNLTGLEELPYNTSWKIIENKCRKTILTDKLEICIIELPKIANLQSENDELLDWLFFLEDPKSERVVRKMKENKELKQANDKLERLSQDEKMQQIAWWRYKAILEENTARSAGFRDGLNQGTEQGIKQSQKEIALKLLNENVDIDLICKVTALSKDEVEKLKQNLKK